MFLLMNKNIIIGNFDINSGEISNTYSFTPSNLSPLPIGFKYIDEWIENRKASKHNAHLKKLMRECGCDNTEGFIKITHAASINDTFWVKKENEDISWNQVSFYQNKFDETISKLAFEGFGLYGIKLSSTSPELSTNGSFRKCWIREDNGAIYLYKRGSDGARNAGTEPYCEVLASELAVKLLGKETVPYELVRLHKEIASKCPLFTNEKYGYVPISRFDINHSSPNALTEFFKNIGSEDTFRRMLVLDSLTFNVDRHADNYGVLVDNDTQKIVKMAPIFDLNLSMLPYIEKEDVLKIGNKLENYAPRIGDDFTRIGQLSLTSEIRKDLINLKGFEFSFRGDDKFPEDRVKFMEEIVTKQLNAILSKDVLYTKDVFAPEKVKVQEISEEIKEDSSQSKYDKLADNMWRDCGFSIWFSAYDVENSKMSLYIKDRPNTEIYINLENGEAFVYKDENKTNPKDVEKDKELIIMLGVVKEAYNYKKKSKNSIEHMKNSNIEK